MYGDKDYLEYSDVVKLSYMMQVRNEDREKKQVETLRPMLTPR